MPLISRAWMDAANAGNNYHIIGRIDYYIEPEGVLIPEEFNYASINFTDDDILENSFNFSASRNEGGELKPGGLVITSVSFTLVNYDGGMDFSGYNNQMYSGRLCLQINCKDLSGNIMYLDMPTYYITSLKENNGLVMIEALDALDCMNAKPSTSLASNTRAGALIDAICGLYKPAPGGPGRTDNIENILPPSYSYYVTASEISTKYIDFGNTSAAEMLRQLAEAHGLTLCLEVKAGSAPMSGAPPDQQLVNNAGDEITVVEDAIIEAEIIDTPRKMGTVWAYDYRDGITYGEMQSEAAGDKRKVVVGGNPFIFGDTTELRRFAYYMLGSMIGGRNTNIVNYTLTALNNPAIRPNDRIWFTYRGTTYYGVVAAVEWTLGGYMMLSCHPQATEDISAGNTATWSAASLPMTPTVSASIGTAGTSCATSTWLTQGSVTFEPGTYLILVNAFFSSNATGRRLMYFSETSSGSAVDGSVYDARMAVDGAASRLKFQTIKTFETSTTLYLRAWQNSGSSLTFTAEYSSIKIF